MDDRVAYTVRCPHCGRKSPIHESDSGHYWIEDTVWICEYCDKQSTTKELQNKKD